MRCGVLLDGVFLSEERAEHGLNFLRLRLNMADDLRIDDVTALWRRSAPI